MSKGFQTRIDVVLIAVMIAMITAPGINTAKAQIVSDFEIDLEGWLITGDNAFRWQATGGNPGGYLDVNDLATGTHNYAVAPPKFLGDWSGATPLDSLSADIHLENTSGGSKSTGPYMFRISGPGGSAYTIDPLASYPPNDVWTKYEIALDETLWTIESGTWDGILANVTSLRVNGEFVYGGEELGIDNVALTLTPGSINEMCMYDDFNTGGTGDWTFQGTNGASNPGGGGNGGGYVSVSDKSGSHSYAYAPAKFLGDWTLLDGNGYITIDLRILAVGSSWLGLPDFIRITGPGGTAYAMIDEDAIPSNNKTWKTLKFPIHSSEWTLEEGNWAELLAWVSELRVDVEYYDGSEAIAFDNFGRLLNSCPPIDLPIVIHDQGIAYGEYHSLIGVSSVALNPADGELYGTVRQAYGSGGGLYTVTGGDPGYQLHPYDNPASVIFDIDGDAYISEDYGGSVYRLEWGGTSTLWVSGFHSGDDDPYGMAFAPPGFNGPSVTAGDILVADRGYSGPDEIWAFSPDVAEGEALLLPDPGNHDFFDIAADPAGSVYLSDALEPNYLFLLHPEGTLSALALTESVSGMVSIVHDDVAQELYVASGDRALWRIDPMTGNVTLIADGFGALAPACLEIDAEQRMLWIADNAYARVYGLKLGCSTDLLVESQTYLPGSHLAIAVNSITVTGVTTVQTGADLTLKAGDHISIGPGFKVQAGGAFLAVATGDNPCLKD